MSQLKMPGFVDSPWETSPFLKRDEGVGWEEGWVWGAVGVRGEGLGELYLVCKMIFKI